MTSSRAAGKFVEACLTDALHLKNLRFYRRSAKEIDDITAKCVRHSEFSMSIFVEKRNS